jgi:hypothetical protein
MTIFHREQGLVQVLLSPLAVYQQLKTSFCLIELVAEHLAHRRLVGKRGLHEGDMGISLRAGGEGQGGPEQQPLGRLVPEQQQAGGQGVQGLELGSRSAHLNYNGGSAEGR